MARVLIASTNPSKVDMYRRLLATALHQGVSMDEINFSPIQLEETGQTAEENAIIKANEYYWQTGLVTLADDTAMLIHGLGGLPGVQVRRWNGVFPDTVSDEKWLEFFLEQTKSIPDADRTGSIQSVCCIVDKQGCPFTYTMERKFTFAKHAVRPMSPGWPMSAVIDEQSLDQKYDTYDASFRAWLETGAAEVRWE